MANRADANRVSGGVAARTLKASVQCQGVGLHSGRVVTLNVRPAPAGAGIIFRRMDLLAHIGPDDQEADLTRVSIPAVPSSVISTNLGTVIANRHGISVSTVEHLMFAFAATGIEHAIVEIDGPEVPIMDGSAAPFLTMLDHPGLRDISAPKTVLRLTKPVRVEKGDAFIEVFPLLDAGSIMPDVDVTVDFADPSIGRQSVQFLAHEAMLRSGLAAARTFCNLEDVEATRALGLGLGGSMENTIVVSEGQILNADGLRFDTEFVRHKALDLIGDLYLLGAPLAARIVAFKPGHDLNTRLAKAVLAQDAAVRIAVEDVAVAARCTAD